MAAWDGEDPEIPAIILQLRTKQPEVPIIVVIQERHFAAAWSLLDIGATLVLEDTCGGERLTAAVRRAINRQSARSGAVSVRSGSPA